MPEETKPPKVTKDWSPDYFPTSARPIYRSVALLIATVIVLCLLASWCSPKDPETEAKDRRQEHVKEEIEKDLIVEEELRDEGEEEFERKLENQTFDSDETDSLEADLLQKKRRTELERGQRELEGRIDR